MTNPFAKEGDALAETKPISITDNHIREAFIPASDKSSEFIEPAKSHEPDESNSLDPLGSIKELNSLVNQVIALQAKPQCERIEGNENDTIPVKLAKIRSILKMKGMDSQQVAQSMAMIIEVLGW